MEQKNFAGQDTIGTYKVTYVRGLHDKKKIISSVRMRLTKDRFLFSKRNFDLSINYERVIRFEIVAGMGSLRNSALLMDNFIKKSFEITYLDDEGQQNLVRFEVSNSAFHAKNQGYCEEIFRLLNLHGIMGRFIQPEQSPPIPNIPAQIKQLAELRDSGVLTDEEFESKKAELLGRL